MTTLVLLAYAEILTAPCQNNTGELLRVERTVDLAGFASGAWTIL